MAAGRYREDLLARLNLWTFRLPGSRTGPRISNRNLKYELDRFAEKSNTRVTFNKEAREKFLGFAVSPEALWAANFRDLNGAVTRMSTLAPGGRITVEVMAEEIGRLKAAWRSGRTDPGEDILEEVLGLETAAEIDPFDRVQLAEVIKVCRQSRSLSEAGRRLFSVSRTRKKASNDADRLRKYLSKFGLSWPDLQ